MVVTFCGHSDVAEAAAVQVWLDETIVQLCSQGARRFLLGGYGRFDGMLRCGEQNLLSKTFPLFWFCHI